MAWEERPAREPYASTAAPSIDPGPGVFPRFVRVRLRAWLCRPCRGCSPNWRESCLDPAPDCAEEDRFPFALARSATLIWHTRRRRRPSLPHLFPMAARRSGPALELQTTAERQRREMLLREWHRRFPQAWPANHLP